MPVSSLRDWLLEIAKALDFIHSQHHIHRDVKPANILFDVHGNAFLGDFGIIKALTADMADWKRKLADGAGVPRGHAELRRTEVVMGRSFDGRVDQYSLAMTIHEVLTGNNCMEGPTPSATVVNQTMVIPPRLTEIVPDVSDAGVEGDSARLIQEPGRSIRELHRTGSGSAGRCSCRASHGRFPGRNLESLTSRGRPGKVPCPSCGATIPAGPRTRGQSDCLYELPGDLRGSGALAQHGPAEAVLATHRQPSGRASSVVIDPPDDESDADTSAATVAVARPENGLTQLPSLATREPSETAQA